jgi:hypothetical protein
MKNTMPAAPEVSLDVWRELYQSATRFQDLAPWNWVSDGENFGLNNEHGVRLMSVLGINRAVFGLACYRGTEGANLLLLLRSGIVEPTRDTGCRQDALLVDYVNRDWFWGCWPLASNTPWPAPLPRV